MSGPTRGYPYGYAPPGYYAAAPGYVLALTRTGGVGLPRAALGLDLLREGHKALPVFGVRCVAGMSSALRSDALRLSVERNTLLVLR